MHKLVLLVESVEDEHTVVFAEAYTGVLDIDFHLIDVRMIFPTQSDVACRGEFARIGEEIHQHLMSSRGVDKQFDIRFTGLVDKLQMTGCLNAIAMFHAIYK